MSVEVLGSRAAIDQARQALRRQNLSFISPWPFRMLRQFGGLHGVSVGDYIKSWDVRNTLRFIQQHVPRQAAVLDIGAYASEILCILHRLGYPTLTGVDLNPKLKQMPFASGIHYDVADFMHTPYRSETFDVVTAISVIEHGFDGQALLHEVSRLLRPNGYCIASFDYWPDKIDTTGLQVFGMDWRIFSRAEVLAFIQDAQAYGLAPHANVSLEATAPLMHFEGKDYTFAWMALQKRGELSQAGARASAARHG